MSITELQYRASISASAIWILLSGEVFFAILMDSSAPQGRWDLYL